MELAEPRSFNKANWTDPTLTSFGIQLTNSDQAEGRYRKTFYKLKETLSEKLETMDNVFTHNPWGEYGHEDHILVFRAIKELQASRNYNIWYSNYCSNRSFNLLQQYISGFSSDYKTLPTNIPLAEKIADIYKKNNCWTWFEDYCWFNEECFMKDTKTEEDLDYGHIFPLNILKMNIGPGKQQEKGNIFSRTLKNAKDILNKQ